MKENKGFQFFPRQFGFFPYVFLVYVILPIIYLIHENTIKLLTGFLLVAIFLLTYRQLYFAAGTRKFSYWLSLQLTVIFVLSTFYSPYNLFLGFFSANFIGWYTNKKAFNRALFAFIIVELVPLMIYAFVSDIRDLLFFIPFFIVMIMSPYGVKSMMRRVELEKQLDLANEQIKMLVKREERVRIARDLHDTLGHTLSLITLKSQLVEKLSMKDPERARKEAEEIEHTSRAALKQVRELVSDMRSVTIGEALLEMREILKASNISFCYQGVSKTDNVPALTQNILGMCLREAATNIVKHSRANHCHVVIRRSKREIEIIISDDGIGFGNKNVNGNGLKGMEERLALIEGSLSLTSHNGTELSLRVPIIIKQNTEEEVLCD
ncbi:two-component system sensor histidine kinase DesK [Scopulibacillus darangshiensis]|uniref:histidine kinase n=1 Tax=Scopulibacillus darangshiensis TaxID=442528 RepID=A0A4R2P2F5_9BACL|nr:sensor histidine kinase [Scopulibacillus darangshiensis]TCP28737.1 two-component system sensor histidine kinase DesK [Scopulibacillus darangshiensis]